MNPSSSQRIGIFVVLALVMAATRFHHFAVVADASWAVFFIAGFALRGSVRWAFPLLIAVSVLVDFLVISSQGLNFWTHYCVSPAYWFLLPAHALLWAGGAWLRARYRGIGAPALGLLAIALVLATSASFLVSNGSFYWLSPVVSAPTLDGWILNLGHWYLPYLATTAGYVSIAAIAHAIGARFVRTPVEPPQHPASRG